MADDAWYSNDPRDQQRVFDADQLRMAFAPFRDRFPDMDDATFEREAKTPHHPILGPI